MSDMPPTFATADLCDAHPEVEVLQLPHHDFGGVPAFGGPVRTVRSPEDNSRVREALAEPGDGAVLVVDGGGSSRVALLGDVLGALAVKNGWAGVIVHGCVRDTAALKGMRLGVKALGACPRKSEKRGLGERDVPVTFGGVTFSPGAYVYADGDGVIVSARALLATSAPSR